MNILVLGGTRFFGRRLVEYLLQDGHEVTIASRGNVQDGFGNRVKRVVVDRTDASAMASAFQNTSYDLVYDQIGFNPRDAKIAVDVFSNRIKRFIFTSTQAVYEHSESLLSETDFDPLQCPIHLDQPTYAYDDGKRQAEAYLYQHAPFEVVAVRVCMVVSGDDDYTERFDFHVAHVAREQSIGTLAKEYPITYVTAWEVAEFLRFLGTESKFVGPVNAGNGGIMSAQELCAEIGKILGKTPQFHISEKPREDADFSPYAPLPRALPVSNDLAKSIGFDFKDIHPQLPAMVEQVMNRLQLK